VPGEGSGALGVMIVGEGPGVEEDLAGRPFVGRAGRLLDELLASIQVCRQDVYVTNVIKDRAATSIGPLRDRPPTPVELAACAPWLRAQIDLIRPRIVVTLGRFALAAFLPNARIKDVHGRALVCDGRTILPLYHPSYALRNPGVRPVLFRDVRALAALMERAPGAAGR
jgi:uracil-DNA glycosylase